MGTWRPCAHSSAPWASSARYGATPVRSAADLHPGYQHPQLGASATRATGRWTWSSTTTRTWRRCWPSTDASASRSIGVSFDGTGYGRDGTIWGGEILTSGPTATGSSGPATCCRCRCPVVTPPSAIRGGWRWRSCGWPASTGRRRSVRRPSPSGDAGPSGYGSADRNERAGRGCVPCSSMGRLFDAVASLLGVRHRIDYEGQAAIELETSPRRPPRSAEWRTTGRAGIADAELAVPVGADGVIDPPPLIRATGRCGRGHRDRHRRCWPRAFHWRWPSRRRRGRSTRSPRRAVRLVGLTGGVFQNVLLLRLCRARLAGAGPSRCSPTSLFRRTTAAWPWVRPRWRARRPPREQGYSRA